MKPNASIKALAAAVGLVAFAVPSALVAGIDLDWWSMDGAGGGESSGGNFLLRGTAGQSDAGGMTGGRFQLGGGFWAMVTSIPTPGAPALLIQHNPGGTVTVSWSRPSTGWLLQTTHQLGGAGGTWVPVALGLYQTNATSLYVTTPVVPGNTFFRLQHP